ncbi:MAG TPA: DUF6167 family protein [Jiangellaceae bacterium]|nr:DUF6167 family protein [Jiangellaceae bacterium]
MRRLFWVAVGATAGVLVVRRINKISRRLTTAGGGDGLAGTLGGISQTVREFVDDVKVGMAERDAELRHALGISTDGGPAPDGDPAAVEALLRPDRVRSSP